jgi:hypothetical protein
MQEKASKIMKNMSCDALANPSLLLVSLGDTVLYPFTSVTKYLNGPLATSFINVENFIQSSQSPHEQNCAEGSSTNEASLAESETAKNPSLQVNLHLISNEAVFDFVTLKSLYDGEINRQGATKL